MAKKSSVAKSVKTLKASDEFVVGKHSIGWVDSDFKDAFYDSEFSPNNLGSFQKLGEYMENADAIEKKLNPGKCTLGDVYAFLQNPPEGTKDGWANLFLIGDKVVSVSGDSEDGRWHVNTWFRGRDWGDGSRVFSPGLGAKTLGPALTLEKAIELVKKEGYLVYKQM